MTDVAAPRLARREHRARTARSRRVNQPACSRAGMGRHEADPSRIPVASADLAEELPYVAGQQVGCFQGGEVAATAELGPVHDVVVAFGEGPDGDVIGEHRHPGRHRGFWPGLTPGAAAFVVDAGRRPSGAG